MPESRPVPWRWVLGLALAVVMLVGVVAAALRYFVPEPSIRRSRREERQRETARKRAGRLLSKVEQSMDRWSQYDYRWPAARAELQGLRYGPKPEPAALRQIEERLRELRRSSGPEA